MKKKNGLISIILTAALVAAALPMVSFGEKETEAMECLETYTGRYLVKYRQGMEGALTPERIDGAFEAAKQQRDKTIEQIQTRLENEQEKEEIERKLEMQTGIQTIMLTQETADNYEVVQLKEAVQPQEFIERLMEESSREIEYIQPDYLMELSARAQEGEVQKEASINIIFSDDEIMEQGQETIPEIEAAVSQDGEGQAGTLPEQETEQPQGDSQVQKREVTVALIDTGVDMSQSQLEERLVAPYDFVKDTAGIEVKTGSLEYSHATHIAGVITSNAPEVKVMPLKVFDNGKAYTSDILDAIAYAKENGADIVNCSWGSSEDNRALYEAMEESDLTFICAAGNRGADVGEKPYYPAAFDLENIISVGSVNDDCALSYFSNYGAEYVDIAARGNDIESIYPEGRQGTMSGTSVSAGFVSAAAAQYLTANPPESLKAELLTSADKISCLDGKIKDGNLLNIDNLITHTQGQSLTVDAEDSRHITQRSPEESWELFSLQSNVKVAAMDKTALFLKGDGTVWMSGSNGPEQVPWLQDIVDIDAYGGFCSMINNQGKIYTWDGSLYQNDGSYNFPKIYDVGNAEKVSCGNGYYLALTNEGDIWGWGINYQGQAGGTEEVGYTDEFGNYVMLYYQEVVTPVKINNSYGGGYLSDMKDVVASENVSYAIDYNNVLYYWGNYRHTSIGTPYADYAQDNIRLVMDYGMSAVYISVDGTVTYDGKVQNFTLPNAVYLRNSMVLNSDGTVNMLQPQISNESGQWETVGFDCQAVEGISGVAVISASSDTSDNGMNQYYLAITNDDKIYGWGNNAYYQINSTDNQYIQNPMQIIVGSDIIQKAVTLIDEQYNNPENTAYRLSQLELEKLGWSEYTNPNPSGNNWQSAGLGEFSAQEGQLKIKKTGQTNQPSASAPAGALVYQVNKAFTYQTDNWLGDTHVSMRTQNFKGKYQIDFKGSFNQQSSQVYYDILGCDYQGNDKVVGRYRIDPGVNSSFSVYNSGLNGGGVYAYPLWSNPVLNRQIITELDSATSTFKTYRDNISIPESTAIQNANPKDIFNMTDWAENAPGAYIKGIRISVQKQETQGHEAVKIDHIKLLEAEPIQDCVYQAVRNLTMSVLTDNPDEVKGDLKPLPTELNGAKITWNSSRPDIISNTGKMMKTLSYDEDVIMTAKITNPQDQFTQYLDFHLTVVRPSGWGETYSGSFTGIAPDNADDLSPTRMIEGLPMWYFEYPGITTGNNGEVHNGQVLIKNNRLVFKKLSDRQTDSYKDCVVGWRWLDKTQPYRPYIGTAQIDIIAAAKGTGTFRFGPADLNNKDAFHIMLDVSARNVGIVYGEMINGTLQQVTQRVSIDPLSEHKYSFVVDTQGSFIVKIDGKTILTENGSETRQFLKEAKAEYALSKLKVWITNITMKNTEVGQLKSVEFTPIAPSEQEIDQTFVNWIGKLHKESIPNIATDDIVLPVDYINGFTVTWASNNPSLISNTGIVSKTAGDWTQSVQLQVNAEDEWSKSSYAFTVKVPKFCKFTDSTPKDSNVQLNLEARNVKNLQNREFTLEYDPEDYEVADLSMLTLGKETKRNQVFNPNIKITENVPGKISFRVKAQIPSGKRISGILNSIQLKSKKNNTKNLKYYVTDLG